MSSVSAKCDVLVVGAGPSGLLTALELARAGLEVEIVDRAWRSAAQSYACGLHAASLEILGNLGLAEPALQAGLEIRTVAFYEGAERKAEAPVSPPGLAYPFVLVMPQDRLEELLEEALREKGIRVRWGHRLDDIRQDANGVTATVEQLGVTSVGYPVVRAEETVESETEVRAHYLVGADGSASHVRSLLGIETEILGSTRAYEIFEFATKSEAPSEIRIALGEDGLTDAFWPQPGWLSRWSLDLGERREPHLDKEREALVVLDDEIDKETRKRVEDRIRGRAPWFDAEIQEIDWTTIVAFDSMVAREFGRERCWLVGDAGHQTSPVGMQSMNIGLREASDLAARLVQAVKTPGAAAGRLEEYGQLRRLEWRKLLGALGGLGAGPNASEWARANRGRLLGCLPASGPELNILAGHLGLVLG